MRCEPKGKNSPTNGQERVDKEVDYMHDAVVLREPAKGQTRVDSYVLRNRTAVARLGKCWAKLVPGRAKLSAAGSRAR